MKLTLKPSKQTLLHIALFLLVAIFWSCIEILGPIFLNIEQGFNATDTIRLILHTLFHAGLIIGIFSIVSGRYFHLTTIVSTVIYTGLSYANLLYFRVYGTTFPFNMIFEFQQLNGISDSIIDIMHWYDIFFLIIPTIFCIAFIKFKHIFTAFSFKRHIFILSTYIIITLIPVLGIMKVLHFHPRHLHNDIHLHYSMLPIKTYRAFGLLPALSYQIHNHHSNELSVETKQEIDSLISSQALIFNNTTTNIATKRNIVIMLMEALNTSCIDQEYMPTLHSLCSQNNTLYCPNTKQLTQGAMSIGGQLIVMSGLNGLRNDIFVSSYPDNLYPSIAHEMAANKHCNTGVILSTESNFWRQDNVNKQLGIQDCWGKKEIESAISEPIYNKNNLLDDKTVFDFAATTICSSTQPFLYLIVPSNMHSAYMVDKKIACDAKFSDINDVYLHEYMRRARYLDDQIAAFINELKTRGLYEDTLIVVTSDHQVPEAYCSDAMKESLSPYIPAIFINTGADWAEQNERNKDVVFCHSQVYPTMLQLMGLRPEKYAGLFPPMTNIEATQEYDFANCAYETTTDKRIKQIYNIEEKIIRSSYFGVME